VPPGYVKCGSVSGATVLDTDIVVDALRDFTLAIDYLEAVEQQGDLRISRPTQMELIVGCRNHTELQRLGRFLRRFTTLDLTESIGQSAVALLRQYRLSHGLLIIDALIAATALAHGETLYTKNVRHFRMIPDLRVIRPY
jgi:predicted nucleic acid-binding protein